MYRSETKILEYYGQFGKINGFSIPKRKKIINIYYEKLPPNHDLILKEFGGCPVNIEAIGEMKFEGAKNVK